MYYTRAGHIVNCIHFVISQKAELDSVKNIG